MVVSRRARFLARAGLLAALGFTTTGSLPAQEGLTLPPGDAAPVTAPQLTPAAPQSVPQLAPAAPQGAPLVSPAPLSGTIVPAPAPLPAAAAPAAPAPAAAPASGGTTPAPCQECKPAEDYWAKLPPYSVFPRMGFFFIPPTGPGYYSVADQVHDNCRKDPPKYPHPRFGLYPDSFFNTDWRYLDKPDNTEHDPFDFLKRQRLGPDGMVLFTTGGELRARYNHEENSRLLNGADVPAKRRGMDNTYDLYRARIYADAMITDRFRLYAEVLSAWSPDYRLPPLPIDRDPADFLNLFVEANLFTLNDNPVWFRLGRQELLYGSQRLISPLEWANTRRTFQGGKLYWHSEKNDLDFFLVQPVIPDHERFDSVDNNIVFAGAWYTHRPAKGQAIDLYYLMLDDTSPNFAGKGGVKSGKNVNTFGARWVGDKDNWLWDVEGMVQTGSFSNQTLFANAFTAGGGYHAKESCWSPTFWVYYDYASGNPEPGVGNVARTFEQLFPFGHYYFGWIDVVGRRNIHDISTYVTVYPTKWMFTQLQVHNFYLDSARDALYNAGGLPVRQDKTGKAGTHVGQELDLIVNFHLSNHSDLLMSYSYMFAGSFLTRTATTEAAKKDPQAVYVQYTYRW